MGNVVIIDLSNGVHRQAIVWTDDDLLLISPLGENFSDILNNIYMYKYMFIHIYIYILENAFENIVDNTVAVYSHPRVW